MKIQTTLVLLSALAAAAAAQTTQAPAATPASTTAAPVATPAASKPAATPAASVPAATPASTKTTAAPAATPAATTPSKFDPVKGCWSVSVERDATYCITGPICSGSGAQPAGWNCPKKGDVATDRCLGYLRSYTQGKCVAPVDSVCKVIHTGAWGCVLPGDNSTVTPTPTKNGTAGGNSTNSTASGKSNNGTIQAPTKLTNLAVADGASTSAATIGAVAAVAAVACAAIGTVLYKKNQNKGAAADDEQEVVDVVTP